MNLIQLPAELVIKVCEDFTARRNVRISAKREEMIADAMEPTFPWLNKILKKKPITREKAIENLERFSEGEYHMVGIEGGYWQQKVTKLQEAANIAKAIGDGLVYVSCEMSDLLEKDFKNTYQAKAIPLASA